MTSSPDATRLTEQLILHAAAVVPICGTNDANLRELERLLSADIHMRGTTVTLTGSGVDIGHAKRVLAELEALALKGTTITPHTIRHTITLVQGSDSARAADVLGEAILTRRGKVIRPKTLGQKRYVDAMDTNTIVFGIGPAGTGKTYLAMAKAVQALGNKEISRIILTRPAVEAGENLGFLPGTLNEKIDPYLRPLYDALRDMLEPEQIPKLLESGVVEVAPLAYMRGRTLSDAFVILDEAQNTTPAQMKMFLTRLGFRTKMIVTGDITQVDLPRGQHSGLRVVRDILGDIQGVHFAELQAQDVVRHRLVSEIVTAYESYEDEQRERSERRAQRGSTA